MMRTVHYTEWTVKGSYFVFEPSPWNVLSETVGKWQSRRARWGGTCFAHSSRRCTFRSRPGRNNRPPLLYSRLRSFVESQCSATTMAPSCPDRGPRRICYIFAPAALRKRRRACPCQFRLRPIRLRAKYSPHRWQRAPRLCILRVLLARSPFCRCSKTPDWRVTPKFSFSWICYVFAKNISDWIQTCSSQ